jgi:hypothetical protein
MKFCSLSVFKLGTYDNNRNSVLSRDEVYKLQSEFQSVRSYVWMKLSIRQCLYAPDRSNTISCVLMW